MPPGPCHSISCWKQVNKNISGWAKFFLHFSGLCTCIHGFFILHGLLFCPYFPCSVPCSWVRVWSNWRRSCLSFSISKLHASHNCTFLLYNWFLFYWWRLNVVRLWGDWWLQANPIVAAEIIRFLNLKDYCSSDTEVLNVYVIHCWHHSRFGFFSVVGIKPG